MNMHFDSKTVASDAPNQIPPAVVGGGFIVMRRNSIGRFRGKLSPYEHGSLESATAEAARMALLNPGSEYVVMESVARQLVIQL